MMMGIRKQEPDSDVIENKRLEDARVLYTAMTSGKMISSQKDLYRFMNALTQETVPFHKVCPHHQTPWDMIWECFKADLPQYKDSFVSDLIAVGPREGFKTLSTAKLNAMELLLKPKIEIASIGAIMKQAARCYKYTSRYLFHPLLSEMGVVIKNIMEETILSNKSRYEQLIATMSSVNSPHPNKLRADEVELMKHEVIEEMKNVPSSYNGWKAQTLYTSTRKFVEGEMSALVEAAKKKSVGARTIIWCYKEVSEPCPDERSGVNKQIYEVEDIFHQGEKVVVEAYEYCGDCQLLPSCRGDLKRAKGVIPIDDSIKKWIELDRDTWLAQKESIEPPRTGLFYYQWDEKFSKGVFKYNPRYPVDLFFDFTGGGEDPTVAQFWQTWEDTNDYLVLELCFRHKGTDLVALEIEQICREKGIPKPQVQMGDSSQMQQIRDLRAASSFFSSLRPVKKIERKEGLSICRRRLRDNSGVRHTFIDESCLEFRREIKDLKRKNSDPDDHKDGDDHSMDAWRYRNVYRYYSRGEPRIHILSEIPDDGSVQDDSIVIQEKKIQQNGPSIYAAIDRFLQETD
jgi:hypothetical protein